MRLSVVCLSLFQYPLLEWHYCARYCYCRWKTTIPNPLRDGDGVVGLGLLTASRELSDGTETRLEVLYNWIIEIIISTLVFCIL